jgi:hypothetical protein
MVKSQPSTRQELTAGKKENLQVDGHLKVSRTIVVAE